MDALRRTHGRRNGFTLVELLIVISILAVLTGILIPTITVVSTRTKVASTRALIARIKNACVAFKDDHGYYPPSMIEDKTALYHANQPDETKENLTTYQVGADQAPPQALFYYLSNGYVGENAPYMTFARGTELYYFSNDFTQQLPAVIDYWSRPIVYLRKPRGETGDFSHSANYTLHNTDEFDVFSVGPDGQTGARGLPINPLKSQADLELFCQRALDQNIDGEDEDDIASWTVND